MSERSERATDHGSRSGDEAVGTPVDDFAYPLPDEAIGQVPVEPRDSSRLLLDRGPRHAPGDRGVRDLPDLLDPGDVLVVNDTRVLPARLRATKATGGEVEVMLLEREPAGTWRALIRPGRRVPPGTVVTAGDLAVEVGHDVGAGVRRVRLQPGGAGAATALGTVTGEPERGNGEHRRDDSAPGRTEARNGLGAQGAQVELEALEVAGEVPLPPYVHADLADPERYQTVYARVPGSVAAPTAGLHLTGRVLDACRDRGVRVERVELRVGLGTFRPMDTGTVEEHRMHEEAYRVGPEVLEACRAARFHGRSVVAVGTTTLRALEASAATGRSEGRTDIFIYGDHPFAVVDRLLTNFHQPRSTLLVLVDAFVGPRWRALYAHALDDGYRFLSFGDCCLLDRRWGRAS